MSNMKRHIGKNIKTDQRCVVAFMQIPGRADHALVVGMDNLPDRIEQALISILESPEGQGTNTLATVLGRRILPETGKTMMETLHDYGFLMAVPIDNIVMLPYPNMPFPLRKIVEDMAAQNPNQQEPLPVQQPTQQAQPEPVQPQAQPTDKFNPYGQTQQLETNERNVGIANMLLAEARDLEAIASSKREEAYRYEPSLRPRAIAPTPLAEPVVQTILVEDAPKAKKPRAKKTVTE